MVQCVHASVQNMPLNYRLNHVQCLHQNQGPYILSLS